MNIYALELDNNLKGIGQRKAYIEALLAKLEKPGFVVLPELAICSYMGSSDIWQYADKDSLDTSRWAMQMAKKYNTYIAVGYLEKSGADYYNSYLVADNKKVYGVVRKSEGEAATFKRGRFGNIIETPIGNIAVGICYDSRRKLFYDNIKDRALSLLLFPHGCPSDPKRAEEEQQTVDRCCTQYMEAFGVPVVYCNSRGELGYMTGRTGKMMARAGFVLNGMTKIYSVSGTAIQSGVKEAVGMDIMLIQSERTAEIPFHGNNLLPGNWLFRLFVLKPDVKAGVRYYEHNKHRGF